MVISHKPPYNRIVLALTEMEIATKYQEIVVRDNEIRLPLNAGSIIYRVNGKIHRDYNPAIVDGKDYYWFLNGKLHNPNGIAMYRERKFKYLDNPYVEGTTVACVESRWFVDGQLHRNNDMPAIEKPTKCVWYKHGKKHRSTGAPAVIGKNNGRMEWWIEGLRHREYGPAVVDIYGSMTWYYYGLRHNVGAPAVIDKNGNCEWYQFGKLHRDDGPASIDKFDEFTIETWYKEGKRHRDGGVAEVVRAHGEISILRWYKDDFCHNEHGPAEILFTDYGKVCTWYLNGVRHRVDGPAVTETSSEVRNYQWHHEGKLHRDDGPAIVMTGVEEWWIHGARIDDNGVILTDDYYEM